MCINNIRTKEYLRGANEAKKSNIYQLNTHYNYDNINYNPI